LWFLRTAGGYSALADIRGGAQQDRICGGSQQISERLADRIGREKILFNQPVLSVIQDADGVSVITARGLMIRGRRLIIAMSPTMANQIHYQPELPPARRQLMMRIPQGSCRKCIIGYKRAWWKENGRNLSAECMSDQFISLTYDDTVEPQGYPAIIAFVVGEASLEFAKLSFEQRREKVRNFLVDIFGQDAADIDLYVDKDWIDEKYTGGCYISVMPPCVLAQFGESLCAPVGRIHWAGTETAYGELGWTGYMEGAVQSGDRVAEEVMAALAGCERGRL
jgi:monoamine oxidase